MDDTRRVAAEFNADIETEVKEMMGLFDLPAFARRGQDLEITLRAACTNAAAGHATEFLDMVQLRLRQWSRAVTGPDAWSGVFTQSIEPLWPLAHAEQPAVGRSSRSPPPATRDRRRPDRRCAPVQPPLGTISRTIESRANQHR